MERTKLEFEQTAKLPAYKRTKQGSAGDIKRKMDPDVYLCIGYQERP